MTSERSVGPWLMVPAIALLAGLFTWLCVGWFGNQPLLTALIAVVLVEVFLASFGVIAMLLTERVTVSLLKAEQRPPAPPKTKRRSEPVWFRLPDPVPGAVATEESDESLPATIVFPTLTDPAANQTRPLRDRAA